MKITERSPSFFQMMIIAIFFGILAGLVTELYYQTYFAPPDIAPAGDIIIRRQTIGAIEQRTALDALSEKNVFVAEFFLKKNDGNALYLVSERRFFGTVLTNDGWILTPKITDALPLLTVFIQGKSYAISESFLDESTEMQYVKIEAKNLTAAPFAAEDFEHAGDLAPILLGKAGIGLGYVENPYGKKNELENTRFLTSVIFMDRSFPSSYRGAPVTTLGGEIVGIFLQNNEVIPARLLKSQVLYFLKNKSFEERKLSLNFADLSYHEGTLGAGVMMMNDYEEYGLQKGDVIISLDGMLLNREHHFSEMLLKFKKGDVVTFEILRSGVKKNVDIAIE